jgi:hypothetical protein
MSETAERPTGQPSNAWWGTFPMAPGTARRWRIGPLTLTVDRLATEWRVVTKREGDPLDTTVTSASVDVDGQVPAGADAIRIADDRAEALTLRPMLADLAIVSRPEAPFLIPPGRSSTIFVGTPLWLQIVVDNRPMLDLPIAVPRRTWFGDRESGQLAYSSRTFAATRLEELVPRPHRARSAVTLSNKGSDDLPLKRLLIPTGQLTLSVGDEGHLWTEDLNLVRSDGELAALELTPRPTTNNHGSASRLCPPRQPAPRSALVRVFAPLLDP